MTTMITTSKLAPPSPDLEVSPVSIATTSHIADPYSLQARLIPADSLRQRRQHRKIRKFYEDQNANIERMLKSVDEHRAAAATELEEQQLKVCPSPWDVVTGG
jgi:uncharacterized protein YcaQ